MNETRRILDLMAQGKITADEAEQLLAALGQTPDPPPAEGTPKGAPKWLRVAVFKGDKREVKVGIPMSLVRAGMKLGAIVPAFAGDEVNQRLRERGIDFNKIDPAHIEEVLKEMGDMTVDVDDGKHQVRIYCE